MNEEPRLNMSTFSQKLSSGDRTVSVEIYRLESDEEWVLEIVDEFNNFTVWDETFTTESAALVEAKKAILEERITSFAGPENGKSDGKNWK